MNINEVAKNWKVNKTQPNWDTYESTQVTVKMCQRFEEELKKNTETIYGVTHLG